MSVIGVDPGLNGAIALFDHRLGTLAITDMPTFQMAVGKRIRTRIDVIALLEYFDLAKIMGVELAVIEAVGGRPKQSASAAFQFGCAYMSVYVACMQARIPIETIAPQTWKKLMKVPGKKSDEGNIVSRANEVFPDQAHMWHGPKGGEKLDRAEAALLAMYAAQFALRAVDYANIDEWIAHWRKDEEAA